MKVIAASQYLASGNFCFEWILLTEVTHS